MNLNCLMELEKILFAVEFDNDPGVKPFWIDCGSMRYYYKVIRRHNKYYVVAY